MIAALRFAEALRQAARRQASVDGSKPAISGHRKTGHFRRPRRALIFTSRPPVFAKVVWTLVRQLRGPHFSTCA